MDLSQAIAQRGRTNKPIPYLRLATTKQQQQQLKACKNIVA